MSLIENKRKIQALLDGINALPKGIPDGIKVLASGTFTPANDRITGVDVQHGLGTAPNFSAVIAETDASENVVPSSLVGNFVFDKKAKASPNSSDVHNVHILSEGYDSSGAITSYAYRYNSPAYFTSTFFCIPCNTKCKLIAGHNYRWICGILDDVL